MTTGHVVFEAGFPRIGRMALVARKRTPIGVGEHVVSERGFMAKRDTAVDTRKGTLSHVGTHVVNKMRLPYK